MRRWSAWGIAIVIGVLFGWIAGGGMALISANSDSSSSSPSWLLGAVVAFLVTAVVGAGLSRLADRHLLGRPRRLAGGVGEESATSNPDREPRAR